jgi:hypothetical protein
MQVRGRRPVGVGGGRVDVADVEVMERSAGQLGAERGVLALDADALAARSLARRSARVALGDRSGLRGLGELRQGQGGGLRGRWLGVVGGWPRCRSGRGREVVRRAAAGR